jgi:hypothetical protein
MYYESIRKLHKTIRINPCFWMSGKKRELRSTVISLKSIFRQISETESRLCFFESEKQFLLRGILNFSQ